MLVRYRIALLLVSHLSVALVLRAETDSVARLLEDDCTECHNPEQQKGRVSLAELSGNVRAENARLTAPAGILPSFPVQTGAVRRAVPRPRRRGTLA